MLAQEFDEATFKKGFDQGLVNAHEIRMAARRAKKYSLDTNASRYLSDLGNPIHWDDMKELRHMARSPHQTIWVEFDNRARKQRLKELTCMSNVDDVVPRLAWLIEQHPDQPSTHRATIILDVRVNHSEVYSIKHGPEAVSRLTKIGVVATPFSYQWDTEDKTTPWNTLLLGSGNKAALVKGDISSIEIRDNLVELATGLVGHVDPFISLTQGYGDKKSMFRKSESFSRYIEEFAGELRYIMAFLASLNAVKVVGPSNIKMIGERSSLGRTLPAYEITEMKITLPKRRKLASYLAQHGNTGIKHRNHDVGGFWRTYEHGAGPFCPNDEHSWELSSLPNKQYCKNCPAWHTWITEHTRGDIALGRVEHIKRVVGDGLDTISG